MFAASPFQPRPGRAEAVRLFISEAPMSLVMVDRAARVVTASPVFLAAIDQGLDAIVGRLLPDVLPYARDGLEAAREPLAAGAAGHTVTRKTIGPDGRTQWLRSMATAWRDDEGEIGGYLFSSQDVTAEHEAKAARREMEDLLESVVDHIPATVAVHDFERDAYALLNARARAVVGLTREEAREVSASSLLREGRGELSTEELAQLDAGGVMVEEHVVPRGENAGRTLRLTRLIFEDRGGRRRMLAVGEDITDLRAATHALEAALKAAEDASHAKTAFLATMSHEIRTPLNGVLGMIQAMARDPLPKDQRRRLEIVRQSGEALLAILNDVLDFSKIEAGKLELEEVAFDLSELVEGASAGFGALASSKGLELVLDLAEAPGSYLGDPTRLRQVLANLISNAVKFTARGEVRVTAAHADGALVFSVADTGPGIAPDALPRLFEKYVQADASTARSFGGTGLGLSICRELCELMGGTIRAESAVGRGARFVVTLPLPRAEDGPARRQEEPAGREVTQRLRVLAGEDNPVNQEVLRTIFAQAGCELAVVGDGAAVLEAYSAQAWDVILIDVRMPVMDGPTAVRRLRAIERAGGRARTPVIALTADALAHQRAELMAGGMDAVVAKPLQIAELFAAIETLVDGSGEAGGLDEAAGA